MGTNFYIMTKSKEARDIYFGDNYELTDFPNWGYEQHIAKTSFGWLPLFDGSGCFRSIFQLRCIYNTGDFVIYDEYGQIYSWDEFSKRVLQFNGGIMGVAPLQKITTRVDKNLPEYSPISHFDYADGKYSKDYFTDGSGYEFCKRTFC